MAESTTPPCINAVTAWLNVAKSGDAPPMVYVPSRAAYRFAAWIVSLVTSPSADPLGKLVHARIAYATPGSKFLEPRFTSIDSPVFKEPVQLKTSCGTLFNSQLICAVVNASRPLFWSCMVTLLVPLLKGVTGDLTATNPASVD